MVNLDLFNATVSAPDAVKSQLSRMPPSDLVMLDALFEAGYQLTAYEDPAVERQRLQAVKIDQLFCEWVTRFRGQRRVWSRPATENEARQWMTVQHGKRWLHIAYEPRLERPIGGSTKRESEHTSAKRRHW